MPPLTADPGAVEFDRVVPPSGNMWVAGKQFWLGPDRAGITITFWADHDLIHLTAGGARLKTVRSHLSDNDLDPAGRHRRPSRRAATAARPRQRRRRRSRSTGSCPAAGPSGSPARQVMAAEILAGRQVTIRIDSTSLVFFDPHTRELLRTRPSPLTYDQAIQLRGARPAGPPPRPSLEPVRVQRRASNTGVIMVAGQKVALGRIHAHTTVTVHVAETTLTIESRRRHPHRRPHHHNPRPPPQSVPAPQGRPMKPRATVAHHPEPI